VAHRSGFVLHIRPDRIGDYVAAHRNVWPEMLEALRSAGFRNYTIFRSENTVFGYFEADDVDAARRLISSADVQARWAVEIDDLLEPESVAVGTAPLEEVFRLD
jgi:L-rhamnose mutarotase